MSVELILGTVLFVVVLGGVLARRRIARACTRRTGTWVGSSTP